MPRRAGRVEWAIIKTAGIEVSEAQDILGVVRVKGAAPFNGHIWVAIMDAMV